MIKTVFKRIFCSKNFVLFLLIGASSLYLCDQGGNQIFSRSTSEIRKNPRASWDPNQFLYKFGTLGSPWGISCNGTGHIYYTNTTDAKVYVCTPTGTPLFQWGGPGGGDGQFSAIRGIACNSTGQIYVADYSNSRIQVFSPVGHFLYTLSLGTDQAFGVAINQTDHLYVAVTSGTPSVRIYSPGGEFLYQITSSLWNLNFDSPADIAFNASGTVFVVEEDTTDLHVFSPAGQYLFNWSIDSLSFGVAVNETGAVYVGQPYQDKISVYTATGQKLYDLGHNGAGNGEFQSPVDIMINRTNHLYVTEMGNHRIQLFGDKPPTASNVVLSPTGARTTDNLLVAYDFRDPDGDVEGSSEILWFKDTVHQTGLDGLKEIPAANTGKGEQWHVSIRPHDGNMAGELNTSLSLVIGNTPPVASKLNVSLNLTGSDPTLVLVYEYNDVDGDLEKNSEIRWYKDDTLQEPLNDLATIPASAFASGEEWYVTVQPKDGTDFGILVTSQKVVIPTDNDGSDVPGFFPSQIICLTGITILGINLLAKRRRNRE